MPTLRPLTTFITIPLVSLLSLLPLTLSTQAIAADLPVIDKTDDPTDSGATHVTLPDPGKTDGTESGGTRGPCIPADQGEHWRHIIPLIPESNLGQTVTGNPTFFFYIPLTNAQSAEFALKDDLNNDIYKTTFDLITSPGIINIKMPNPPIISLMVGQEYHWDFALICNAQDRKNDLVVKGWIKRMQLETSIERQLSNAKLSDLFVIYRDNNIWYDALAVLAELKIKDPNDPQTTEDWENLLKSFGLSEIVKEPLIKSKANRI